MQMYLRLRLYMNSLFWIVLRSIVVPYVAYLMLRESFLGDKGALLAVAIALAIVTGLSLIFNLLKILGNTVLLRGHSILMLGLTIIIQLISLGFIWYKYFSEYSDFLNQLIDSSNWKLEIKFYLLVTNYFPLLHFIVIITYVLEQVCNLLHKFQETIGLSYKLEPASGTLSQVTVYR